MPLGRLCRSKIGFLPFPRIQFLLLESLFGQGTAGEERRKRFDCKTIVMFKGGTDEIGTAFTY